MTTVLFRKSKTGEIIAFFPAEHETHYDILCYAHIGQHCMASTRYYLECKQATPDEYKPLYDELINLVGYELNVKKRISPKQRRGES
jgi:hypothetical protein